jgi:hypothetical protein
MKIIITEKQLKEIVNERLKGVSDSDKEALIKHFISESLFSKAEMEMLFENFFQIGEIVDFGGIECTIEKRIPQRLNLVNDKKEPVILTAYFYDLRDFDGCSYINIPEDQITKK